MIIIMTIIIVIVMIMIIVMILLMLLLLLLLLLLNILLLLLLLLNILLLLLLNILLLLLLMIHPENIYHGIKPMRLFKTRRQTRWIPFGDHPLTLEWYAEDLARPLREDDTHTNREM